MNTKINWEQIAKDNNMSIEEFIDEIFLSAVSIMSLQMDERNINEISVAYDEYELICKKQPKRRKKVEYNH